MNRVSGRSRIVSLMFSGSSEDRPAFAATLMVAALFMLGFQDALVKQVSGDVSLWQFQALRASLNFVVLIVVTRLVLGRLEARPARLWPVALRSFFLVCAMCLFFGGIPFLSLPEIAAGLYVFPLFVAILSSLLLGERVGPRRLSAIFAGFIGTLLILKPGSEAFKPVGLMPIGAALCYASTILTTRRLCRAESPVTLTVGVAVVFILIGGGMTVLLSLWQPGSASRWPYLLSGWHALDWWVFSVIAVCSLINMASNIFLAKAYQSAESSWLAPFDYSYLVFATFWGFVFWGTTPDALTIAGMTLIAGAGSYVVWRENQLKA